MKMHSDQKEKKTYSFQQLLRLLILGLILIIFSLIFIFIWIFFFFDERGQFNYTPSFLWIIPGIIIDIGGIISVILIMKRFLNPSPEERALLPANSTITSKENLKKMIRSLKIGMYSVMGIIGLFVIVLLVLRFN
ncbi:hypothetical protein [Candidatus Lokiarchaeum ossiferum]|uniref:hypothetical protein n=1 Tax=Candidatus Lokiarchaeum ossiferum TaxID=2951803 RepID=UPI00352C7D96